MGVGVGVGEIPGISAADNDIKPQLFSWSSVALVDVVSDLPATEIAAIPCRFALFVLGGRSEGGGESWFV